MQDNKAASSSTSNTSDALQNALAGLRGIFAGVLGISALVNILALTGALYMLQVYDRVLTSHSVPTLVALTILVVALYLIQGILDVIRGQILIRLGARIDRRLSPLAHAAALQLPLVGLSTTDATQPIRDVDAIRTFFDRQGPIALCDLPWIPVYLAFVFFLHPQLGLLAFVGLLILILITALTDRPIQRLQTHARESDAARQTLATAHARNAEVLQAMGLYKRAEERYENANDIHRDHQTRNGDITSTVTGITKVFRMMLQSAMLGFRAYLTLQGEISAGAIIAGSVAATRAFAPIEIALSQWRSFVAARQSFENLKEVVNKLPTRPTPLDLPAPKKSLMVENISVAVPTTSPSQQRLILNSINFKLEAGQGLGIIGPSASGKSTLARAIAGVWPLARGAIRFDGAARERWSADELGGNIGYLPQDIELFDSTITENISRFDKNSKAKHIIAAAKAAGVHDMILRLENGYETTLGPGGQALSGGQRQRIALARALYGEPFLVILDEPNANLDAAGDQALHGAIKNIRQRGGIVVVIAHRPSAVGAVDTVAVLNEGKLIEYGDKEDVLRKVLHRPVAAKAS
ncbi:MAG: type I secretion system permease/ATPase [Hyphomicrobiaceae bacterium]